MTSKDQTSPLPWVVEKPTGNIIDRNGQCLAINFAGCVEEADLMVRRVNQGPAFDAILEALKRAEKFYLEELEAIGGCDHEVNICVCGIRSELDDLRAALKLAEESK